MKGVFVGRKKKSGVRRVQLTVKRDDDVTMDWLAAQSNICASIRLLIRDAMARYGCVDFLDAKIMELYPDASAGERVREADIVAADPILSVDVDETELWEETAPVEDTEVFDAPGDIPSALESESVSDSVAAVPEPEEPPLVQTVRTPAATPDVSTPDRGEDLETLLNLMQGGMGNDV